MNEDRFWIIIDKIGWRRNSTDYKKLGIKLSKYLSSVDELHEMRSISKKLQKNLIRLFYDDDYRLLKDRNKYWGGDDSFWDFRAHIVGLGKDFYYSVLNNFKTADKLNYNFVECFDYIFTEAEELVAKKEIRINKINKLI